MKRSDRLVIKRSHRLVIKRSDRLVIKRSDRLVMKRSDRQASSKTFRQASNNCKRVLGSTKRAYANKTKKCITSQKNWLSGLWVNLLIAFSAKVNLYLLYSTARKCCLLDLIKQNCLQKSVKNYRSVNFLSLSSKVFEKLVDYLGKCGLFLISSMVLGLLDLLQIFW